jgi:DNA-binding transcriptional regulator YdaS (Cro superfamily)
MLTQRQRPILMAMAFLAAIWIVAFAGYTIAKHAKITPEKVRAYVLAVDFSHLSGAERARAIQKLADMLNALSLEERRALQMDRTAYSWFEKMSEPEKGEFIEATLPTGFKQTLAAFEEMPEDKRRRVVEQALKQMKDAREKMAAGGSLPPSAGTNGVVLSEALRQQVTTLGLKSFYSQSSAQTKAELAPLLEEMQHMMENGAMTMRVGGPRR